MQCKTELTLAERRGGGGQVVGRQYLQLHAPVDGLEAGGQLHLGMARLRRDRAMQSHSGKREELKFLDRQHYT